MALPAQVQQSQVPVSQGMTASWQPPYQAAKPHPRVASAHLDVSQRLARANDLQSRLMGGGQSAPWPPPCAAPLDAAAPLPFDLHTPNLLDWYKDHGGGSGGSQAFLGGPATAETMGRTLHALPGQQPQVLGQWDVEAETPIAHLRGMLNGAKVESGEKPRAPSPPPPPRSAPAAAESLPLAGAGGGGVGQGTGCLTLTLLMSDSRWEALSFSTGENLEQKGVAFLAQKGLKAAFQSGLIAKMRSMIASGQSQASVDIIDLL